MNADKIYEKVTKRILDSLSKGSIPWKKPWKAGELPKNLVSGKPYQGINLILTAWENEEYFLTFNQIKALKGHLKAGSEGTPIIFWSMSNIKDKDDPEKMITVPFLRHYTVFALRDVEGIERPAKNGNTLKFTPIEECETIVKNYDPVIKFGGDKAYYSPTEDYIGMPAKESFASVEHWYGTLFHEIVHSSGSQNRLKRFVSTDLCFGNETYAKEELVAELGSAFLCAQTGIDNSDLTQNNEAYIKGWMRAIALDPKLVVSASSKAKAAVNYILEVKDEEEVE